MQKRKVEKYVMGKEGILRTGKEGKDKRNGKGENKRKRKTSEKRDGQEMQMTKRKGCKRREREERKRPTAREKLGSYFPRRAASGNPSFSSHRPPLSSPPAVCLCVSVRSAAAVTAVRSLTDCSGFLTKSPSSREGRAPKRHRP